MNHKEIGVNTRNCVDFAQDNDYLVSYVTSVLMYPIN